MAKQKESKEVTPEAKHVEVTEQKADNQEATTVEATEQKADNQEEKQVDEAYIKGAIKFIDTNARRDAFEAAARGKEQDESSLLTKEDTVRIAKQNATNRLEANKAKQAELVAIQEAEAAKQKEKK